MLRRLLSATVALAAISGLLLSEAAAQTSPLTLLDGTPVRLRLNRNLSSADATVGETADFEVLDDVKVGDAVVIAKGSTALATVTEAQAKRRMGRGGKLDVNVDHVRMINNEKVALRAVKETKGGGHAGAMTGAIVATSIVFFPAAPLFLLMHGKDIAIPKGTEITAYVNGDVKIDPSKLATAPAGSGVAAGAASLAIASTPSGADIEIDGKFSGSTPSTLKVNFGSYKIAMKRSGFKAWERQVDVGAGASINVSADLEAEK